MVDINGERLLASLQELGRIGALAGGGVCRLALTDEDKLGRDWVVARMRALGMAVSIDGIGNVVGTHAGAQAGPPVMTGSHIDTVRTGGLYDGNYGVLAGLEVVQALQDAGIRTAKPIAVAFFTNEEGARFAPDMMGSLVFQGDLPLEDALRVNGIDGTTVGENLRRIGYCGSAPVGSARVDSYVELHIEQGPVLDLEGVAIGAVEGVQGISWTRFALAGVSNHAGTTPMRLRRDAGLVAARIACFARDLARELGGNQVATVGSMNFLPNLVNVIPNRVTFTVDLRNTDEALLAAAEQRLWAYADEAARDEGVELTRESLARFEPVDFDPRLVDLVERTARDLGLSVRRLPSGAGHDAQMLARMCPAGMIFVPSVGGLSHNVREHTEPEDLVAGARVLLRVLLELAGEAEAAG
ncbi:MAG TPA: Zn-dependent hydrolase [Casimicrobiaceae bacterium]|jgi:N-carbamoyl-L-amino-acid hydrolase|nr:Zn-dependent hydrolase [Casimicrobiaceae bacterium]